MVLFVASNGGKNKSVSQTSQSYTTAHDLNVSESKGGSLGLWFGSAQCTTPFDGLVLLCGNLSADVQLCLLSNSWYEDRKETLAFRILSGTQTVGPRRETRTNRKGLSPKRIVKGSDHNLDFYDSSFVSCRVLGRINRLEFRRTQIFGRIKENVIR